MTSSLALIRWNQPEENQAVATIDRNPRPEGRKWALFVHALLNPSPGRTLNHVHTSLGKVLEKQANRAAYTFGLGPHVVANKIISYFGSGEDRARRLEVLRISGQPELELERRCAKLMKYTQPTESRRMQCHAFKKIVDIATLFPGLRLIFLGTKYLGRVTSIEAISALWERPTGASDDEWTYWQNLAATCLADSTTSVMIEGSSVADLSNCQQERLSVVEQLLVLHDCSNSKYLSALCIRYLHGILELPGFWQDSGKIHSYVANKICSKLVQILKDIGIDILALGPGDESEPPFDYDGVDSFATNTLTGISNWLNEMAREKFSMQPWYDTFCQFVQLLRMPRALELLPESSACATTTLEDIIPTGYLDAKINVTVNSQNETTEAPNMNHDCSDSLAYLHCNNDSTASVHTKASDQDDAQGANSDYEDRRDTQNVGSSELPSENGSHVSSASEEESHNSDIQLNDVRDVPDFEFASTIGQGSESNGFSDPANLGTLTISGENALNSTSYPSFEALQKEAEDRKITLRQLQSELGDDHKETLNAMGVLAQTYFDLGEYRLARSLQVVVLEKRRALLGEDALALHSMAALGQTSMVLGQLKEAETLNVQLLALQRDFLGNDHPATLQTMHVLALVYRSKGQLKEAETLQVQVLEKSRQLLGEDHPETIYAFAALAGTYREQRLLSKVEPPEVHALGGSRQVLGEHHRETLGVMGGLVLTYFDRGYKEKAEKLEGEVINKRRRLLGEHHPTTLLAMANQAEIYQKTGRPTAAEELGVVTLEKQKKLLGDDHSNTIRTMANLGWIYMEQGQLERAEKLNTIVLERRRKNQGDDHADTQQAVHNLAETYRALNKAREAEHLEALLADHGM